MREATCRESHICMKCGEPLRAGEKAIQSESLYGRFWHVDCTASMYVKWSEQNSD